MRVSRSAGYGMLAVNHIAEYEEGSLVRSDEISQAHGIPIEYLLKICQNLVRANILRSKRGPQGGFALARKTDKISLLNVIEAVDGPMSTTLWLEDLKGQNEFTKDAEKAFQDVISQTRKAYDSVKFSQLVAVEE